MVFYSWWLPICSFIFLGLFINIYLILGPTDAEDEQNSSNPSLGSLISQITPSLNHISKLQRYYKSIIFNTAIELTLKDDTRYFQQLLS